jgi:pimeloyl-ACP methyl ester carboxylesterase
VPPRLPRLAGVEHRFIDLGTRVRAHVAEAGPPDAPAVLCLHGWPQHWWMWRRVLPLLDDSYRLVCPDLRGLGWSGWPDDGDFAKQRLADDALALLDALPPKQRAAVALRYVLDLDDPAIAHALGCSTSTVRSQVSRALESLRLGARREGVQP